MSGVSYASSKSSDARELVRLALNTPQVTQYFHFDERPERVPLIIVNHSPFDLSSSIDVAGYEAKVTSTINTDENVVEIQQIEIDEASADLSFQFSAEGIRGEASFTKEIRGWNLKEIKIVER